MDEVNQVTEKIVDCSVKIHKEFGPGLVESVYELVLAKKLIKTGMSVERQRPISFSYEELQFKDAFRIDLLVDEKVIVEIKSVDCIAPIHTAQLLTYLRLLKLQVGLLLNFGAPTMKEGIKRMINGSIARSPANP